MAILTRVLGAALAMAIYLAMVLGILFVFWRVLVLMGVIGSGLLPCQLPLVTPEALLRCFAPVFLKGALLGAKWGAIIGAVWGLAKGLSQSVQRLR